MGEHPSKLVTGAHLTMDQLCELRTRVRALHRREMAARERGQVELHVSLDDVHMLVLLAIRGVEQLIAREEYRRETGL